MAHHLKYARQVAAEVRHVRSEVAGFLLSIELWLMVLAAASMVAGFWLAFMGDWRCLQAFGFALGYPVLRVVLHLRRLLAWPFF
ncbi:hypothetical protein [Massilia sp. HP4]|uniref:hypothetical protein n=1 Tax=Massilia sp. HP4 TaxID=2562316 RepID=UPI0010BFAC96|nr:hypothetical protein [Massilia sp. HP4]